jgi:hypothetical protein
MGRRVGYCLIKGKKKDFDVLVVQRALAFKCALTNASFNHSMFFFLFFVAKCIHVFSSTPPLVLGLPVHVQPFDIFIIQHIYVSSYNL